MASPSETISLCKILTDSKSIIRSHLHHFQALTVLFVFPLSLSFLIYPTIQTTFLSQSQPNFIHLTKTPSQDLVLILLRTIIVMLFSCCSIASISYSTFQALNGEPVNLIASIKSIFNSFLPLLSTVVALDVIVALISVPFIVLVHMVYKWLHSSGVEDSSNLSSYFLYFVIFISLVYIILLMYLQVNWILAYVVVVVESKWGYEPLQRSAYLIKGNRGVALSMQLYFALLTGGIFWVILIYCFGSRSWWFFLYVIFGSVCLSFILLINLVANVILYVYSRDLREGLPYENTKKCPLLK